VSATSPSEKQERRNIGVAYGSSAPEFRLGAGLATDWNSLQAQVTRWQAVGALGWSEEDIVAVTRHLNDRFYGFTPPANPPVVFMPTSGGRR
jgi:hypothetical protein